MGHTNNIVFIACIVLFWFFEGFMIHFMLEDSFISGAYIEGNTSYDSSLSAAATNYSSQEQIDSTTRSSGLFTILNVLFGWKLPTASMPAPITLFFKFINWLLAIVAGLLLYRVFNPLS